jgi:dGTPase
MRTRQDLENSEAATLRPYAAKSGESAGRHVQEAEHPYRTAFQRDRDRIVHTRAFRRLEYKTQVFVNDEGDHYRTRLTHTLEVAQIARTVARALGVNEDLTETISLAHDLGHTPFGHAGQDVMAELMKDRGGFEHNRQSFRIVTKLESPYPEFLGLNLTTEVLEGIMKHADQYDLADGTPFVKIGYPSIEAQIANVADEIAYNNHDVDDGLNSGLIEPAQMREVELWETHYRKVAAAHPDLPLKRRIRATVKAIIDFLVTDLLNATQAEIDKRGIVSFEDVKSGGKSLVGFSPKTRELNADLKKFLFKSLYRHPRVERMAEQAGTVIAELFDAYHSRPDSMPKDFLENYEAFESRHRIVCDYIAGMTDRFASQEHARLFGPAGKNELWNA